MNVADAMTPREDVVTVSLPGTRDDALEYLRTGKFSSVAVVKTEGDEEVFRGLVSRETLIERPDEDQLALLVEEGATIGADASIEALCSRMVETGARRVPVVSERPAIGDGDEPRQHLEGIVTMTDVLTAMAEGAVADGETTVETLATRTINTVYAGTPLVTAERELSFAGVPYAMVLDEGGEVVGILTDVDLVEVAQVVEGEDATGESIADEDDAWMWEGIKAVGNRYVPTRNVEFPDGPVAEFMSDDLVTVGRTKTATEAARLMLRHDIEQLPLVVGGELVGIVRDVDLLGAV